MKKNKKEILLLTKEGYQKLKKELEERQKKQQELLKTKSEMAAAGDLRENDGYALAMSLMDANQNKIAELQEKLANCKIIKTKSSGQNIVNIGSTVTIRSNSSEKIVTIVSEAEADPMNNKISDQSPLGQALLKKKKGDTITIQTPAGKQKYEIKMVK